MIDFSADTAGLTAAVANFKCVEVHKINKWIEKLELEMDAQVLTASDQRAMNEGGTQAVLIPAPFTPQENDLKRLSALVAEAEAEAEARAATGPLLSQPSDSASGSDEVRVLRWYRDLLELLQEAASEFDARSQKQATANGQVHQHHHRHQNKDT